MKELLLDAETLYTREQLHDVLAKVCGFPPTTAAIWTRCTTC